MCREIALFRELGAEAVVIGALSADGSLDLAAMERMLDAAKGMDETQHRAFDVAKDPFETLETAAELGINTILTSGQHQNCLEGKEMLKELRKRAAGRVDILAGAGIDAAAIRELAPYTRIASFHMSGKIRNHRIKMQNKRPPKRATFLKLSQILLPIMAFNPSLAF